MEDPRRTARALMEQHVLSLDDLWMQYWANGGNVPALEFDAYLNGTQELDAFEAKVLTWALEDLDPE